MTTQVKRVDELARLRSVVDSALTVALWLHVPLIAGVAWFQGNAGLVLGGSAFMAAASATISWFSWPAGTARRSTMGVALVVMVSLLLAASAGGAWQTDIHMYYFAALAVLATYCDRNVIIVAAAVTAVHHLVLSFVAPALVFSGDSELGRVFLHAGILVIEAGALIWLTSDLDRFIRNNAANLIEADSARIHLEAAVAAQEAAQRQAADTRHKTMIELSARFESSIGSIVESVAAAAGELHSTSEAMAATAQHTTGQATAAAASSDRATRHVQDVGTATEALSVSIAEITQKITQTTVMIKDSVSQAAMSNEQVRGLTDAADKIGDVVRIISDIAGQTNLLALNATIEAARAGDAGKGFAVVASEVKALATQTAKATDEIAAQIKAIQVATQSSAQLIQATTDTIRLVDETTAAIAAAVERQGTVALDIARGVRHAAEGTQDVSGGISGVNQAAQQTGEAAAEVLSAAGELSRYSGTLRAEADRFLREVRAA